MSKHLSAQQIDKILSLLDSWPSGTKLGWDTLRQCLRTCLLQVPSRQALARHDRIQEAFRARKVSLRTETPISASDPYLAERVRRLEAENHRLRVENQALLQRFVRWLYNAYKRGVMPQHLDEPCPEVDRPRSD